ncbi:MAG TPA: hypothetical protein VNT99_18425 [Methylomirabilota bacterium]|nr:hypothetical protein [Methylomirabilota bacterium]
MQPLTYPITTEALSLRVASYRRVAPLIAVLFVCLLFGLNLFFFANSAAYYLPYASPVSDMHATMRWSESIVAQGWLNPNPHHPYVDWMQACGSVEEWHRWWQDPRIFQQSPLYAYVLAAFRVFSGDLIYVLILQTFWAIAFCGCIGWIAARISGRAMTGWLAFLLAATYAPFHAYSVLLLRDGLSYLITAGLLAVLVELQLKAGHKVKQLWLSAGAGVLLGLGFLTRESFFVIVPMVWIVCGWMLLRRKQMACAGLLVLATVLAITPLLVRNALVGAPLLSSSNRFAEGFIWGHAHSADPTRFVIPTETRQILERSQGRPLAVVRETLATHPNIGSWLKLTGAKVVALLDPFELPDNVSFYFMEQMSPTVRFGLKYWMILVPGIAGLVLSALQRDRRHGWLWLLFPLLLAGILMGMPMSRYRQILAVIFIPSAAYFATWLWMTAKQQPRRAVLGGATVLAGWALCLGPFSRVPKERYERAFDYVLAANIYESAGRLKESEAMKDIVRTKFPEVIRKQ